MYLREGTDDAWDIIVTFEIDESWDSPHEPFVLGGKVCQHQTTLISSCNLDYYGETNIIEAHWTNSVNLQRDVIETSAVTIWCIQGIPNQSHLIIAIGQRFEQDDSWCRLHHDRFCVTISLITLAQYVWFFDCFWHSHNNFSRFNSAYFYSPNYYFKDFLLFWRA